MMSRQASDPEYGEHLHDMIYDVFQCDTDLDNTRMIHDIFFFIFM